jgi:NAD(P)-dependent dehydrogenase (short-subunit alcohol dehydrogenase family)
MHRFDDRTAIVTGGSLGIGRAIAERLASEGARVLITGRNAERLEQAARQIDGDVICVPGDMGDPETPQKIATRALERWGQIDVLINNAGLTDQESFLAQTREDWDYVIAVVLTGPYFLAQKCAQAMVKQRSGAIVNITSIDAHGYEGAYAYGAAKAGLLNLTRYMAVELGPYGVRANAVSPGWVHTAMMESFPELHDKVRDRFERAPLKRMIKPEEIAATVAFLASDDSSATTGAEHLVDAGLVADLYVLPTVED